MGKTIWASRVLSGTLAAALVGLTPALARAATPPPPPMHAASAAVLDAATGQILWQYRGHTRYPMASTTKMMTALIALRLLHDNTSVPMVVPPQVSQAYGETLYLKPGQHFTFLQLLEGTLLYSANDAAVAVAVNAAGSQRKFVALMNAEANTLGLVDTHYANPDGLESPDHYSSADDLARLGLVAMQNPIFRHTVAMTSAAIPWPGHGNGTRVIGNIDTLLTSFPGATGIKTGYTSEALNVAVGSATRNGRSVIAVVMGESEYTLWPDEYALLNYALQITPPATGTATPQLTYTPAGVITARVVPARQPAVARAGSSAPAGLPPAVAEWVLALLAVMGLLAGVYRAVARPRRRVGRMAGFQ